MRQVPGPNPRLVRNNFDLLRFALAFTVFVVHCQVLSGEAGLAWIADVLSSEIAVKAFFVVSGLLVFMSYERSERVGVYFDKRIRRIGPAYVTVVLACAFGLYFASSAAGRYFGTDWLKYVGANLAFANFVHPGLPGVFAGNQFFEVNGALWTLKIEVMFYASVPLIVAAFRRLGRLPVLTSLFVASLAYAALMDHLASTTGRGIYAQLSRQLPGQLSYFMAGAFFYYYLEVFERRAVWFLCAALVLFALHRLGGIGAAEPAWLATFVALAGLFGYAGNFGRYGDFSYGVYILHFPIVQLLVQAGVFRRSAAGGVLLAAAIVVPSAVVLWHFVERPLLRRTSHYVQAS